MKLDFLNLTEELERIYSRRLALRPVALSDAWPLFLATRNPMFNRHLMWPQPECEQQVLERLDGLVDAVRRGALSAVSAVVKPTGEWASLFRFQPYRDEARTMEMGVWTHDRFWHGRYSLELGRLCVDAAFQVSGVERLVGAAAPENRGSNHLMEAVGMLPSDLIVRQTEDGRQLPLREFEITRERWMSRRGHSGACSFEAYRPTLQRRTEAPAGPRPRLSEPDELTLA